MNIERKQQKLREYKKFLNRKFKGCDLISNGNGKLYIADSVGKNLIGEKYPDLALADDVFTAWKNAYLVEHWNRQEARSIKGIKTDIKNNTVQGGEGMSKAIYEYFEDAPEIYDEENHYE
jgi:hypothetical protein